MDKQHYLDITRGLLLAEAAEGITNNKASRTRARSTGYGHRLWVYDWLWWRGGGDVLTALSEITGIPAEDIAKPWVEDPKGYERFQIHGARCEDAMLYEGSYRVIQWNERGEKDDPRPAWKPECSAWEPRANVVAVFRLLGWDQIEYKMVPNFVVRGGKMEYHTATAETVRTRLDRFRMVFRYFSRSSLKDSLSEVLDDLAVETEYSSLEDEESRVIGHLYDPVVGDVHAGIAVKKRKSIPSYRALYAFDGILGGRCAALAKLPRRAFGLLYSINQAYGTSSWRTNEHLSFRYRCTFTAAASFRRHRAMIHALFLTELDYDRYSEVNG